MATKYEIFYDDLCESAQKDLRDTFGLPDDFVAEDRNWDICPIAILEISDEPSEFEKKHVVFDDPEDTDYSVGYRVSGRFYAHVHADSKEEAKRNAEPVFWDADFGELEEVEGDMYCVDGPDGDTVYLD